MERDEQTHTPPEGLRLLGGLALKWGGLGAVLYAGYETAESGLSPQNVLLAVAGAGLYLASPKWIE